MKINPEIKIELKRVVWDYAVDENILAAIFEGKTATFSLNKEKLYSRLLLSTPRYRLLDCLGVEGLKEILTTEMINSIWIKDIREKFTYAREALHGLKIDFVNEMVFHRGEFKDLPLFGPVDNEMNILANKITCITRYEVKDIVDIFILAKRLSFFWRETMDIALKKSPVDPLEVSRVIKTLPREELKMIKWAFDADLDEIYGDLQIIAADILLGRKNTFKRYYQDGSASQGGLYLALIKRQ